MHPLRLLLHLLPFLLVEWRQVRIENLKLLLVLILKPCQRMVDNLYLRYLGPAVLMQAYRWIIDSR